MARRDDSEKGGSGKGGKKEKPFNNPFAGLSLKKEAPAPPPASKGAPPSRPGERAAPRLGKTPSKPSSATPVPGAPPVSDEETRLFLESVGEVVPVRRVVSSARLNAPAVPAPRAGPSEDEDVLASLSELVAGDAPFELSTTSDFISGALAHLDPRILKRLKRGEYGYQATLDLHGRTREQARADLEHFLVAARHAGHRAVLVVHGRGTHSPGQVPILKEGVQRWLAQGRSGRQVLAFATALPADGGEGAVYVLLRR